MESKAGRKHAKALFIQYHTPEDKCEPIYDIEEFHKVFLEECDLFEYAPAMRLVGSWDEWCRLKRDWGGFNDIVEGWKDEVEQKLSSEAMAKVYELMQTASAQTAASLAKFLAQHGWKRRGGAGRPSKAEVDGKAKDIAARAAETKEEASRIFEVLSFNKDANG